MEMNISNGHIVRVTLGFSDQRIDSGDIGLDSVVDCKRIDDRLDVGEA